MKLLYRNLAIFAAFVAGVFVVIATGSGVLWLLGLAVFAGLWSIHLAIYGNE